ncbi:hypothetical protein VCHC19A1_3703, partial [Vibrio cholerae HC-19A1]
MLGGGGKK